MNEMPDFDMLPPDPPSPKKPRRKPMKRAKRRLFESMPKPAKKPRKRRKIRKTHITSRKAASTANGHTSGKFTDEVYRMISTLMGMKGSDRDLVLDIVKGLVS